MDDFSKEIGELKQFIVELKADRAATKEKEKRDAWTKYVSITVVFIAVLASIASQWAGKYGTRTESNELKAFDQWNLYQALAIKLHTDEIGLPLLKRAIAADADGKKVDKQVAKLEQDIQRYEDGRAKAKAEAEEFEAVSKAFGAKAAKMSLAVSFFSVAIAMMSMCLVTKRKPLWILGMVLAAVSLAEMIWSWTT